MTSDEAKQVLHAQSLGDVDAEDPLLREAMVCLGQDPQLRAWFDSQQNVDRAIADRLGLLDPPAGLEERILARRPSSRASHRRGRYVVAVGLAACVAMLGIAGVLLTGRFTPPVTEFTSFRSDMATYLETLPPLELRTDQWSEIERWLAKEPGLGGMDLPGRFRDYPGIGCREVVWHDRSCRLVCFAARGHIVHLLVLPRPDLAGAPTGAQPVFGRVQDWHSASWRRSGVLYLVLTRGDRELLDGLLARRVAAAGFPVAPLGRLSSVCAGATRG